jgi:sugar lactone lactonase YvrE
MKLKYLVDKIPDFTRDMGLIPLSDDFLVNSMWGNILLADDGYIYSGGGNHETIGGEVWLFRFDPKTGKSKVCSSISDVLGVRATTTAVGESKIHTRICQGKDGKIYFGTMQGGIGHISKLPHYWHPDQYEGGHLFEYDPRTEITRDLGIPVRCEGLQTMVMDRERNVLYLITWPKKTFLKYDLNTHRTTIYGVFGWSPTSKEKVKIHLGRELIITDKGMIYAINNFGCLFRYNPDTEVLEDTDIMVRENDSLRIHVRTKEGIIYFATSLGYLFRMDPKTEAIEPLGQVTPYNSVYTPNMVLSNDETKLYYLAGSHGAALLSFLLLRCLYG